MKRSRIAELVQKRYHFPEVSVPKWYEPQNSWQKTQQR